jgi:hypothetical protein
MMNVNTGRGYGDKGARGSKLARMTDVSSCKSIAEVLDASHTNWDVVSLTAGAVGLQDMNAGGFKALVRPDTNTALAYVGSRFRANSHRAQLYSLDTLVRNGDLVPAKVSMWDNGAMLAFQFRAPSLDVEILQRRVISPLLTLAVAYGSQLADSAFFTDFDWFCTNQMGKVAPLMKGNRVQHRGDVHAKYGEVMVARLTELGGELSDRYASMRRMTTAALPVGRQLTSYIGGVLGATEQDVDQALNMPTNELKGVAAKIPEVLECYAVDDGGAPGSVWHAYSAVTRYETHKAGHTAESRNRRMLFGAGAEAANAAWEHAARLAA